MAVSENWVIFATPISLIKYGWENNGHFSMGRSSATGDCPASHRADYRRGGAPPSDVCWFTLVYNPHKVVPPQLQVGL